MAKRQTHDPFVWHSAVPRRYAPGMLMGALCVLCAGVGYWAGSSAVRPQSTTVSTSLSEGETAAHKSSEWSSTASSGASSPQSSAVASGSPLQTIAPQGKGNPTGVVLLNPNANTKPKEIERQSLHSATSAPKPVSKALGSGRPKKEELARTPLRAGTRLETSSEAKHLPTHNALMHRRDNTYRDYRELRESMLR